MSYSRKQLEAFGEPLGDSVTQKKLGGGYICGGGGGGSSPPPPSQYDPYSTTGGRMDAANKLNALMANPTLALSYPGYQATLQAGTKAMEASSAATGTTASGAQLASLMNLGQSTFGNYYNQMINQLGTISGATSQTPSGAASAQSLGAYQQGLLGQQTLQSVGQGAGYLLDKSGIFGQTAAPAGYGFGSPVGYGFGSAPVFEYGAGGALGAGTGAAGFMESTGGFGAAAGAAAAGGDSVLAALGPLAVFA